MKKIILFIYLLSTSSLLNVGCFDIGQHFNNVLKNYNAENQKRSSDLVTVTIRFGIIIGQQILTHGNSKPSPKEIESEKIAKLQRYRLHLLDQLNQIQKGYGNITIDGTISVYKLIVLNRLAHNWNKVGKDKLQYAILDVPKKLAIWNNYLVNIDRGTPNTTISDSCLAQLLASDSCSVSSECLNLLYTDDLSFGHQRKHQILFLLVLIQKNCTVNLNMYITKFKLLSQLCSYVYNQYVSSLKLKRYEYDFRDLALEQALFCSLSQFMDFLSMPFIKEIASWSTDNKCIANSKRSPHYCENHLTSLIVTFWANLLSVFNATILA